MTDENYEKIEHLSEKYALAVPESQEEKNAFNAWDKYCLKLIISAITVEAIEEILFYSPPEGKSYQNGIEKNKTITSDEFYFFPNPDNFDQRKSIF